ncbi:unnamed protein product, partial [Prorocentrum cordatum]
PSPRGRPRQTAPPSAAAGAPRAMRGRSPPEATRRAPRRPDTAGSTPASSCMWTRTATGSSRSGTSGPSSCGPGSTLRRWAGDLERGRRRPRGPHRVPRIRGCHAPDPGGPLGARAAGAGAARAGRGAARHPGRPRRARPPGLLALRLARCEGCGRGSQMCLGADADGAPVPEVRQDLRRLGPSEAGLPRRWGRPRPPLPLRAGGQRAGADHGPGRRRLRRRPLLPGVRRRHAPRPAGSRGRVAAAHGARAAAGAGRLRPRAAPQPGAHGPRGQLALGKPRPLE